MTRALQLYADLVDGEIFGTPQEAFEPIMAVDTDALMQEARAATSARRAEIRRRLVEANRLVKAPDWEQVATLARHTTLYDVTEVLAMLMRTDCELPDVVPPVRLPHTPLLYAFKAPLRQEGRDTWIWWIMGGPCESPAMVTQGIWIESTQLPRLFLAKVSDLPGHQGRLDTIERRLMAYAMLLLSCRNSPDVVERAPRSWRRLRDRLGLPSLESYHLLKVFPRESSGPEPEPGTGLGKRFHAVRGHFKETKWGRFWWHPFWRGRRELGIVVKDYQVVLPQSPKETPC